MKSLQLSAQFHELSLKVADRSSKIMLSNWFSYIEKNKLDCANECGGSASIDDCGVCGGDGSSCATSTVDVTYNSDEAIAGFQFNLEGAEIISVAGIEVDQSDFMISGNGDLITSDDGILAIGSGGNYALAAARALLENTDFSPAQIVSKALKITSQICIYTNDQIEIIELT